MRMGLLALLLAVPAGAVEVLPAPDGDFLTAWATCGWRRSTSIAAGIRTIAAP